LPETLPETSFKNMSLKNWRLEQLLSSRKRRSTATPWPDIKRCQILKDFTHRGRELFAFDRYKGIAGDVIELEAAEAKQLQAQGFVSAHPAADRFKIGQYPAWKPWAPIRLIDCDPRVGDPTIYDECWVRVQVNGGPMAVCAGLVMRWTDGSFYLPFHYIRVWSVLGRR
jgi:hypothetical protein